MQADGNLVMYPNDAGSPANSYWKSDTYGAGNTATLNLAGGGLLYLMNGTDDKCAPTGLCGFNAFCNNDGRVAKCHCLPGFDFVRPGNETSGCERNFTAESCKATDAPASYTISMVANVEWPDNISYSVVAVQSENDCRTECLQDCNCEAAFYQVGSCSKQRLPLRYGRMNLGSSNAVLVKVGQVTPGKGSDTQEERRKERVRVDILAVSLSLMAIALVIIIACGILLYRNRVWLYKNIPTDCTNGMIEDVAPRSFTYDELKKVTGDFREVIGKGAFGIVYRGTMSTGQAIAVKRLEQVSTDREREFRTEMLIIGRTHHRNLVRLLGYSLDTSNKLLVYEYMSNGSLADLLFAPEKLLCWEGKMGIIIHCDIKPGNILIDENRRAKISDFGLSKLLNPDQTNTFTGIRGTRGYVAPEWHKNLPITAKADVYSFGIVLLEIICSRRNIEQSLPEEEMILENWVYDCFQAGELNRLVDEEEGVDRRQLDRMVKKENRGERERERTKESKRELEGTREACNSRKKERRSGEEEVRAVGGSKKGRAERNREERANTDSERGLQRHLERRNPNPVEIETLSQSWSNRLSGAVFACDASNFWRLV
ncbi:hypothetical protein CRG98_042939 [Punica granatum]|uniref:non-specific serine/threonine protein kinase n=1 Tax=Punica granatum TaxID=22663 RepID=A0A2I0HYS2_PUNGR|nr:hypothetical protein CRG98_042939 [Punica granatum]